MRYYLPFICCLGVLSFLAFYPGMMSPDSDTQWEQAVSGVYDDWHPPVMAWWWGWLARHVWSDPAVLLVFHLLLFWGGVYALGRAFSNISTWLAYLCIGLWFVPPVMGMTAVLWKDTGMACSWFFACSLMAMYNLGGRKPGAVAVTGILLLLLYGAALRYNAILALPPLCYWLAVCLRRPGGRRRHLVTAGVFFCVVSGMVFTLNQILTTVHSDPKQVTMVFDLGRVSTRLGFSLFPDYLQERHTHEFPPKGIAQAYVTHDPQKKAKLMQAYTGMLRDYPEAYLAHRWEMFSYMARIGVAYTCVPYWWNTEESEGGLQQAFHAYLESTADSFWYIGIAWLVIALELAGASLYYMRRGHTLLWQAGLLSLSGILYMLPYFIAAGSCDFRYLYWTVTAVLCALLMAFSLLFIKPAGRKES